ncbi:uncharacterized protein [Hetaerina americana]|uniref:uncharacterized protein n=1 Tax=Hetaerina americana TaxID=62018 RepID=UPI003A7F55D1
MRLFNRLTIKCAHWAKNALLNPKKTLPVPYLCTPMNYIHHDIMPDTLLYRFFKFFETCPKYRTLVMRPENLEHLREKFIIKYALLSERENSGFHVADIHQFTQKIRKLPLAELFQFIAFLSEANVVKHSNHHQTLLKAIDDVCSEKIPDLSIEEAVKLNYCWLALAGTRFKLSKSFSLLMDNFRKNIKENAMKTSAVILILFCSGIARKDPNAKEIVALSLNIICNDKTKLHGLSTSEIIIISEVAFKTSSQIISPTFTEHLLKTVVKNITKLAWDPANLVVVLKAMRHNKIHNWNFLKSTQKCLVKDKHILKIYNFAAKTHLIALYADALYGDQEFMNYLIGSAISSIDGQHAYNPHNEKGKGRAKDLARLLWATSYLGFKIEENILERKIIPVIMEKINHGVYSKQLHILLDTVLSLWIMGYKPLNMLPFVFTEELNKFLHDIKRIRYMARLQLLLTCISIESPESMDCINLKKIQVKEAYNPREEKLLVHRPFLNRVFQDVRNAVCMLDFINVTCENSLPHLNIPGILLTPNKNYSRKLINVEVLDDTNCLHESGTPNGLMLLKLRLLRKLGHNVILVNYDEYENQHTQILLQIEDEIKDIQGH